MHSLNYFLNNLTQNLNNLTQNLIPTNCHWMNQEIAKKAFSQIHGISEINQTYDTKFSIKIHHARFSRIV